MFKEETDKRYCKENMDLDGVGCASCKIKFGDKEEIGAMVPSVNVRFMFAVGEHCMIVFTHFVILVIQKNQTKVLEKGRCCGGVSY